MEGFLSAEPQLNFLYQIRGALPRQVVRDADAAVSVGGCYERHHQCHPRCRTLAWRWESTRDQRRAAALS